MKYVLWTYSLPVTYLGLILRHIVWTRSRQDWPKDEQLLIASGKPFLHLPCIKIKAKKSIEVPPSEAFDVGIFTSTKAVESALNHKKLSKLLPQLEVYAFGTATCRALVKAGIPVKEAGVRSAEELTKLLLKELHPTTRVLVFQAAKPAFDIVNELLEHKITAEALIVYETLPDLNLDATKKAHYEKNLEGVICFASPTAVEAFVNTIDPQVLAGFDCCEIAVIGQTTEKTARRFFTKVAVCDVPSVPALIDLAVDLIG